jgi:hypothetical protein
MMAAIAVPEELRKLMSSPTKLCSHLIAPISGFSISDHIMPIATGVKSMGSMITLTKKLVPFMDLARTFAITYPVVN